MKALRAPVLDEHGVPIAQGSRVEDSQLYHMDNDMVSLEVDGEENGEANGNGDINGGSAHEGGSTAHGAHKRMTLRAPSSSSIRGWWRWAWTTLRVPDSMVFRLYGIDVWSYLQFMKFCIAVFFVLSIGTSFSLLVAARESKYSIQSFTSLGSPSFMLTLCSPCALIQLCFRNLMADPSMDGENCV